MEAIAVVTILVLVQYLVFGFQVGQMREKHGVKAPAMTGHPEFERMFRIHQNTLEQLPMLLPALWIFGYYVSSLWGVVLAIVFIIGRQLYKRGYLEDPSKRDTGFGIATLATAVLMLGGLGRCGYLVYQSYVT